jgi:hypothetical protein
MVISSHEKCAKNQNLGAGKGPECRQPLVKKKYEAILKVLSYEIGSGHA